MKKSINLLRIFIIFILLIVGIPSIVHADARDILLDIVGGAQDILTGDIWGALTQDYGQTMDTDIQIGESGEHLQTILMISRILGVLQVIGSIGSVIALLVIGIRYMFSSLEDKAAMKGVLIYYVVGAILIFATSNVLSIAYRLITGIGM